MKRFLRNLGLFIFPFLIMILVNELIRPTIKKEAYTKQGVTAINSAIRSASFCSWNCHNDTQYCKQYHIRWIGAYQEWIDPIYFGMIKGLKSTGNYGLANILFLVILAPLLMFVLLVKILNLTQQIKNLKSI